MGHSGVKVTISKATTYITKPLRKDGYVDYVAALNARCSRGVRSDNNMAIPFMKAVGPELLNRSHCEEYFRLLSIPPLPEKGDYFVSVYAYVKAKKIAAKPGTSVDRPQVLLDQEKLAMRRPWSERSFPTSPTG